MSSFNSNRDPRRYMRLTKQKCAEETVKCLLVSEFVLCLNIGISLGYIRQPYHLDIVITNTCASHLPLLKSEPGHKPRFLNLMGSIISVQYSVNSYELAVLERKMPWRTAGRTQNVTLEIRLR